MAIVFPLMMLVQMLSGGAIGGAVTGVVARTLGAGNMARAEALLWQVIYIAFVLGLTLMLIYLLAGEFLLRQLGAQADVLEAAKTYIAIFFPGSVLLWLSNMMMGVVRGSGNMRLPAALMAIAAVIQVPLSGLLILGAGPLPGLGLAGAAISVLTVNAINVAVLVFLLATGRLRVRFNTEHYHPDTELISTILKIGGIVAISPFFTVFTILFVTALVGQYGTAALAGYGIAARVEFLVIPLVFGLGVSMNAMSGACIGAGDFDRAERVGWVGGLTAGLITGSLGILLALYPEGWIEIFSSDPDTVRIAARYFEIAGPFFGFLGMGLSLFFASQGSGAVGWPVVATACRFIVAVGGGWLIAHVVNGTVDQLYMCIAAGMVLYGLGTTAALYLGTWRKDEPISTSAG